MTNQPLSFVVTVPYNVLKKIDYIKFNYVLYTNDQETKEFNPLL